MKRLITSIPLVVLAIGFSASRTVKGQDGGWAMQSFEVRYDLQTDGSFNVREDIAGDFGALERHGIFRDMPVEYRYDDKNNRLINVSDSIGNGWERGDSVRDE